MTKRGRERETVADSGFCANREGDVGGGGRGSPVTLLRTLPQTHPHLKISESKYLDKQDKRE